MNTNIFKVFVRLVYVLLDVACVLCACYLVTSFRSYLVPYEVNPQQFFSHNNPFLLIIIIWVPIILFFNQTHGLYNTRREQFETSEIWEVIKSVFVATLVVIVTAYLLKVRDFPRSIMVLTPITIMFLCSLWRVIKKILVSYLVKNGYNNFNALIVGAGKVGVVLAEEIIHRPEFGIKVVGYLDDFKKGKEPQTNIPIVGIIEDFPSLIKKMFINKVFITIYHNSEVFNRLLDEARRHGVSVRVVPQGYEWMMNDVVKYNLGIVPVLSYYDVVINYRQRAKRLFDFVMAFLIFILLLPALIIIGVLIKFDSPGPILYRSKRYGLNGRIFHMLKFRSMVANADDLLPVLKEKNEVSGPIFKMKKDPRITKLGCFLRKYSLDELPQIINVLLGDMSLVGPRPLPIDQIEKEDLRQLKRLDIRPGITGLWQIKGRSDVSFDRLVRWDIWYINNWSFSLDIYILFQTIPAVLKGRGAY